VYPPSKPPFIDRPGQLFSLVFALNCPKNCDTFAPQVSAEVLS